MSRWNLVSMNKLTEICGLVLDSKVQQSVIFIVSNLKVDLRCHSTDPDLRLLP